MTRKFVLHTHKEVDASDFAAALNEEQFAVATAPGGPMLVVAGAGTGKTRALTYRLAWLVRAGVDCSRILLVTFTNRAAREMVHRVELLIEQGTQNLWAGTFHHVANRVLRRYGQKLGLSPEFSILDREDASGLLKSCVPDSGVKIQKKRFPQKRVLMEISSFLQNTLRPLEEVLARRYPMFLDQRDELRAVLDLYATRKRERQLLDYDDLLAGWLILMQQHPDVKEILAEQFQHVLVDEYQDTNAIQGAIVDALASKHRNVCVVGDDSQAIYSFRGASFENIIRFKERYQDAREYRLETNYRSIPEILALANASIAHNEQRLPKVLHAVRPAGLRPAVTVCRDGAVQAQFIAEYILHLLDQERKLNDIAVLYRSHWHSIEIQLELRRRNVPFQVRGGLRFFEQAHIKDVVAHLRVLQNPMDELAWLRVLQLLPRVGGALSNKMWQHVSASADPLAEAAQPDTAKLLPVPARPFYAEFVSLLGELRALPSPADMMERILRGAYGHYLDSHYEHASLRKEDIRGMISFAGQYNTLEAFLADIALAGEFSGENIVNGPDEQEFVILSTVHQAKGLEWPVVFIPWLSDGRFPTDFALNTREDEEEERRVFHVAVTRAKDELYLLCPQFMRSRTDSLVMMKPSRFLTELTENVTEKMELEEGLPDSMVGQRPAVAALPAASPARAAVSLPLTRTAPAIPQRRPKKHAAHRRKKAHEPAERDPAHL